MVEILIEIAPNAVAVMIFILYLRLRGYKIVKRNKYRWACPEEFCRFSVDTNHEHTLHHVKNTHIGGHVSNRLDERIANGSE